MQAVNGGSENGTSSLALLSTITAADQTIQTTAPAADQSSATSLTSEWAQPQADASSVLTASPPVAPARSNWMRRYQATLVATDLLVSLVAAIAAFGFRFGAHGRTDETYAVLVFVLPLLWVGVASLNRAYDAAFVGNGATEYQRVYWTFVYLVAGVAIVSYALKADLARGFILVDLPLTLALALPARFVIRKRLHHQRARGEALSDVIVIGAPRRIVDLTRAMKRDSSAGLNVIGACLPDERWDDVEGLLAAQHVNIIGALDDIQQLVRRTGATTVVVTSPDEIGPEKLRWISWQLEATNADLVVSPGLIEVAGTRISVRPVSGLPLLHVDAPRFSGPHRLLKGAFDRILAALGLLVFSPVLLFLVLLVRLTSSGPALFRQTRVGRNGETFTMLKLRSMYTDAEQQLAALADQNENADGLLFKMRNDPRVTRVGRVLRRFSLDELPQLFNVLGGSMSLVGPRPPLPAEVARYGDDVRRRLLVRPGLTGLWQVSGRSNLSWEDSVRLDLRYVENWSLSMDLLVLWKTARAILSSSGAY